ncbi:MAG TPA: endonuclease/exonuclease/phosphatase family protein [Tepidisphaeraceae bacterium]|nr:endonuclease/exonuclease/phosphatase family protein [Tepidisphaeraceae bacterium]
MHRLSWIIAVLFAAAAVRADDPARQPGDLKVLSFNIRFGTAKDGADHWDKRKDFLLETIKKHDPDLLGTQETLPFQADFLKEKLPGYTFVGAGRDDGKAKGEMAALFFRTERFEKVEEGHYWMSPTPDVPGSKGWDAALPRVTTWVKLKEKAGPKSGRVFTFFNTHFDHMGKQARTESAKMLRQRIEALGDGALAVVTGDFNAGEASEPYKAVVTDSKTPAPGEKVKITDTFRAAHPDRGPIEGTFNGFKGTKDGARIDWILHTPGLTTVGAGIDRVEREGRTPSDHFPVWALLR